MHELSVAIGVVDVAEKAAKNASAQLIESIELEIGELAGIEKEAFEYAWPLAVQGTMLEEASRRIRTTEGEALCLDCGKTYALHQIYEFCPYCDSYRKEITKGKELKVLSIEIN
jgi:hydrogenase nickel incorporation protein HypA/HybF